MCVFLVGRTDLRSHDLDLNLLNADVVRFGAELSCPSLLSGLVTKGVGLTKELSVVCLEILFILALLILDFSPMTVERGQTGFFHFALVDDDLYDGLSNL